MGLPPRLDSRPQTVLAFVLCLSEFKATCCSLILTWPALSGKQWKGILSSRLRALSVLSHQHTRHGPQTSPTRLLHVEGAPRKQSFSKEVLVSEQFLQSVCGSGLKFHRHSKSHWSQIQIDKKICCVKVNWVKLLKWHLALSLWCVPSHQSMCHLYSHETGWDGREVRYRRSKREGRRPKGWAGACRGSCKGPPAREDRTRRKWAPRGHVRAPTVSPCHMWNLARTWTQSMRTSLIVPEK